jgi:hypothetical protein
MPKALRDVLAGLVFVGFGLAFAVTAWTYDLGTALRMGPGMFPLILGGCLVLLGVAIVVEGVLAGEGEAIGPIPWRGIILLTGAVVFFGFAVERLGLAPSLFVTVLIAAFSSERTSVLAAFIMAFALTAFCVLIFVQALGMPVRLIGPWLAF